MHRSKHGLRAIGLCLMATLGLVVFAASAQAETGANFMVNGTNVNSLLLPEVQVKEIESLNGTKEGILLFTTKGGTKVDILCTEATLLNVKLEAGGKLSLGKVRFHKCITKLNGTTSAACEPHSGASKGLIETQSGIGLIVLHLLVAGGAVQQLVRITPDVGTLLAKIELGEECSIGESVPVDGVLTLQDPAPATESVEHLISQGPLTSLTALGQPATLDGSALVRLVGGTHLGLKFSGLPAPTKP